LDFVGEKIIYVKTCALQRKGGGNFFYAERVQVGAAKERESSKTEKKKKERAHFTRRESEERKREIAGRRRRWKESSGVPRHRCISPPHLLLQLADAAAVPVHLEARRSRYTRRPPTSPTNPKLKVLVPNPLLIYFLYLDMLGSS
jgi:hypothetical protein